MTPNQTQHNPEPESATWKEGDILTYSGELSTYHGLTVRFMGHHPEAEGQFSGQFTKSAGDRYYAPGKIYDKWNAAMFKRVSSALPEISTWPHEAGVYRPASMLDGADEIMRLRARLEEVTEELSRTARERDEEQSLRRKWGQDANKADQENSSLRAQLEAAQKEIAATKAIETVWSEKQEALRAKNEEFRRERDEARSINEYRYKKLIQMRREYEEARRVHDQQLATVAAERDQLRATLRELAARLKAAHETLDLLSLC